MSSTDRKKRTNRLITIVAAIVALVGGYYLGNHYKDNKGEEKPTQFQATVIPDPIEIRPFTLVRHEEIPFTLEDLKGKWTFIYFGYTFCPDICPMSLTKLVQVINRLADEKALLDQLNVVFISVDPQRDTPERLHSYAGFFNPKFLGVTGKPDAIKQIAKDFGTFYRLHEPDANGNYPVDHSSTFTLINPDGRIAALFGGTMEPSTIAAEFIQIAKQ